MPPPDRSDAQTPNYHHFGSTHHYSRDDGLIAIPLAVNPWKRGPDGKVLRDAQGNPIPTAAPTYRLVQLHAPIGHRRTDWVAEKEGAPPMLPAMGDTPSGDIFVGGTVTVDLPAINGNQTALLFRASGSYEYIQGTPRLARFRDPATDPDSAGAAEAANQTNSFQTGNFPFATPLLSALAEVIGSLIAGATTGVFDFTQLGNLYLKNSIPAESFSDGLID